MASALPPMRERRGVLRGVLSTSWMTYSAVRFLCAKRETRGWQPELAVCVPPMSRTILDAVFLVVFMFEDLPSRIAWYYNAGMDEYERDYERHFKRYGAAPTWAEWLQSRRLLIAAGPASLGFTRAKRKRGEKPV
jgi:hypothetical protein